MSQEAIKLKEELVGQYADKIKAAKSVVLVDYRGLTVAEDTALRSGLRGAKIEYAVVKNRILVRAFEKAGYPGLEDKLKGPTAIAISSEDPVAPAKILADSAKKTNKTALKGGVVEGRIVDEAGMQALAKIPARNVLIAQMLGMLTSPMRSLAVAMSEIAKKQA